MQMFTDETSGKESSTQRVEAYSRFARLQNLGKILIGKVHILVMSFVVITTIIGFCLRFEQIPLAIIGILAVFDFVIYLALQILEPQNLPSTFRVPLVPLVPLMSITINILLITRLPYDALVRLVVWSAIGVVLYLAYGIRNSNLNWVDINYTPHILPNEEVTSMSDTTNNVDLTGGEIEDSTVWKDDD